MTNSNGDALSQWEQSFRAAARRNQWREIEDYMHRCGVSEAVSAELMVDGIVDYVRVNVAFLSGEEHVNGDINMFLAQQKYFFGRDCRRGSYFLTFDSFSRHYGRLVTSSAFEDVQLVNLLNHQWPGRGFAGYTTFSITRTDYRRMTEIEIEVIEHSVIQELLSFNRKDKNIAVQFEREALPSALEVMVLRKR